MGLVHAWVLKEAHSSSLGDCCASPLVGPPGSTAGTPRSSSSTGMRDRKTPSLPMPPGESGVANFLGLHYATVDKIAKRVDGACHCPH